MAMWYDESNNRRGVLSEDAFQQAIENAVAVLLFLASDGPSTVEDVASGVTGMDERRAAIMLDRLVDAGGATKSDGSYTGVLVESGG